MFVDDAGRILCVNPLCHRVLGRVRAHDEIVIAYAVVVFRGAHVVVQCVCNAEAPLDVLAHQTRSIAFRVPGTLEK